MGLDMYVFRVKKTEFNPNNIYSSGEIGDVCFPVSDKDGADVRDILPMCQEVSMLNTYFDYEKIQKHYGFSEKPRCWQINQYGTSFEGKGADGKKKSVTIEKEDLHRNYEIRKVEKMLICDLDAIVQWRKERQIQAWFHRIIPTAVENCGYYRLTKEMIDAYNQTFPEEQCINPYLITDDTMLVYHEWY